MEMTSSRPEKAGSGVDSGVRPTLTYDGDDMEKFSRENQRRLLEVCRGDFPEWSNFMKEHTGRDQALDISDLSYLAGHGLIELEISRFLDNKFGKVAAKITARGIDFLADDGGLSAVLGVITVKLHDDTLRVILIDRVQASPGDETLKGKLVAQLKSLPADAMKTLGEQAVLASIRQMPNAVQWLQTTLGAG